MNLFRSKIKKVYMLALPRDIHTDRHFVSSYLESEDSKNNNYSRLKVLYFYGHHNTVSLSILLYNIRKIYNS